MIHTQTESYLATGKSIFVAGDWLAPTETFEVVNPADPARVTALLASGNSSHVRGAYASAHFAVEGWSEETAQVRSALLMKTAALIEAETGEATQRLTADMGKARRDAFGEVLRAIAILRYYAGEVLQASGETYPSADPDTTLLTLEEPVGTVAVVTPWNFPFAIPMWKIAPALVFGNTVVWKPASTAAGSAVFICEAFRQAGLPAGVLNLVTGSGSGLSESLTSSPTLSAVTFTGSAATGAKIQESLVGSTVKLQLEMGGKNPAIVLADADLADAAVQISRGAMLSTGQRCTATSRTFVQAEIFDEFTQLLVAEVAALKIGDPNDPATDVGPVASAHQFRAVNEYIGLAKSEGVTFLTGDPEVTVKEEAGFYVHPTVLTDVDVESRLIKEEIFGPVLIVTPVDGGLDRAIGMANDTEFGLASAIFTSSLDSAMKFVRLTESGLVHVNRETAGVEAHVPFGGLKASSNAQREQGNAARRFFTNTKTVYLRTRPDAAMPGDERIVDAAIATPEALR